VNKLLFSPRLLFAVCCFPSQPIARPEPESAAAVVRDARGQRRVLVGDGDADVAACNCESQRASAYSYRRVLK
jgi:hypothetical protein